LSDATDKSLFQKLLERLNELGRNMNSFAQSVEASHRSGAPEPPASGLRHPASRIAS